MFSKKKFIFPKYAKQISKKSFFGLNKKDNYNQYLNLSKLSQISTSSKSPGNKQSLSFIQQTSSSVRNVSQFAIHNSSKSLFSLKKKKGNTPKTTTNTNNNILNFFPNKFNKNHKSQKNTNKIFVEISEEISHNKPFLGLQHLQNKSLNTSLPSNTSNNSCNSSLLSKNSNYNLSVNHSMQTSISTVDTKKKKKFDLKLLKKNKNNYSYILSSLKSTKSISKLNSSILSKYDSSICVIERQFKSKLKSKKENKISQGKKLSFENDGIINGPEEIHIKFVKLCRESKRFYHDLNNRLIKQVENCNIFINKKENNDNRENKEISYDIEYCENDNIYLD